MGFNKIKKYLYVLCFMGIITMGVGIIMNITGDINKYVSYMLIYYGLVLAGVSFIVVIISDAICRLLFLYNGRLTKGTIKNKPVSNGFNDNYREVQLEYNLVDDFGDYHYDKYSKMTKKMILEKSDLRSLTKGDTIDIVYNKWFNKSVILAKYNTFSTMLVSILKRLGLLVMGFGIIYSIGIYNKIYMIKYIKNENIKTEFSILTGIIHIQTYENGKLINEVDKTIYGSNLGKLNEYDEEGNLVEVVINYRPNGNIEKETPYKNGKKDGVERKYSSNGEIEYETTYKDGIPDGITIEYRLGGGLEKEIMYKNGRKDGITTEYRLGGGIDKEIMYKNDKEHGITKEYNMQGNVEKEIMYNNGEIESVIEKDYLFNNLLTETVYKNGKKNGIEKIYHKDGSLKEEVFYKNGVKEGPAKLYYENGKLEGEIVYVDDEIDGIAKYYYENGNIKEEVPYANKEKHGVIRRYYENGVLKEEITYDNGKQRGRRASYNSDGTLSWQHNM